MKYDLKVPWIESPFFLSELRNAPLSKDLKGLCKKFYQDGYVIIDLNLSENSIKAINSSVEKLLLQEETTFQANHYEYSKSPRIFQGWKQSKSIRDLACNKKIMNTLEVLYGRKPFPFSTINFTKGAQQPLHSDSIHFQTMPYGWIAGCWVALEDIDENSGPLQIIPGSHKIRPWSYQDLGIRHPDSVIDGEKKCYRQYEEFIKDLVKERKDFKKEIIPIKKGQCLIWAAELLHGSIKIKDKTKTRKSQAIHYSFEKCTRYFHPMFSNIEKGEFADKWCNEQKNILSWKEKK